MPMDETRTVFNFADPDEVKGWQAIDDRIMGGCSLSRAEFVSGGGLRFRGVVSFDNGGGFASIRSPEADYDLGGFTGLRLRLRGDGKRYKLGLRTDRYFDGVSYQAGLFTENDEWLDVDLLFGDFHATHHGRRLTSAAALDPARIQSFGLFIAERQDGPFRLEVAEILVF
jgi:hypothetical protein